MKIYHLLKKYLVFLLLVFTSVSCFEDELYLTAKDSIPDEEFFKLESNAEAALIAVYRGRDWWRYTCFGLEYYGDASGTGNTSGPSNQWAIQLSERTTTPENEFALLHYNEIYAYITRCNGFLHFSKKTNFKDPNRKNIAQAEAHFMRGMYYYFLTMIYGSVPNVINVPAPLDIARATTEENYIQIIEDLQFAIDNLPIDNIGIIRPGEWESRANKYAAMGLMAKVLMSAPDGLKDYVKAQELINQIIDSKKYSLLPFYGDLMMVNNKDNEEGLFLINFTSGAVTPFDGSNAASLSVGSQTWFRPTTEFHKSFETGDSRKDVNIDLSVPVIGTPRVRKLRFDPLAVKGFTHDCYPQWVLRYADILLIKAEILAKLDYSSNATEIFNLVEQVRNRAFKGASHKVYSITDLPTYDQFMEFLWWERRKEFFYEIQSFFDAKRMDMCQKMLKLEEWQEVFPFSTATITLNPSIIQNPGYK